MKRIDKENYYLDIAETVLERSTCLRRCYGAIIVKNDEIVSTGYNGAPRGRKNCLDLGYCAREAMNVPSGERYELCRSVHAEMNAGESPLDAHDQLDHIEQEALRRLGIHLVIHYDPIAENEDWNACRALVEQCAVGLSPDASIHDLRIVDYQEQKKLTFDLAVPYDSQNRRKELKQQIDEALRERGKQYTTVIRFDAKA